MHQENCQLKSTLLDYSTDRTYYSAKKILLSNRKIIVLNQTKRRPYICQSHFLKPILLKMIML